MAEFEHIEKVSYLPIFTHNINIRKFMISCCGIPWHFRKRAEQIELLTFCHIFKSCTQDSSTVLAVMTNVIQQRKSTMPMNGHHVLLTRTMLGVTIVGASFIARQQGAAIRRLDFTDAQGGKGACDRKAATFKVHMRVMKMSHTPFWGVNLPL